MTSRNLLTALALCATLSGVTTPVDAYFEHPLSGTVIGSMNKTEKDELLRAVNGVLDDGADRTAVPWSYPATGSRTEIKGKLTPIKSTTDQGQSCRQLNIRLQRAQKSGNWTGWFCKQSDGRWLSRKVPN
ncbi:RT0821/Lpp0805 family surface protein [Cupriavidus oxalaticus]|uniref:RT0821/Lpp0805 family surface protein n=1 Tax=Cupriavidus oxalaticus TaxID=96344 RepID=UPI003176D43C